MTLNRTADHSQYVRLHQAEMGEQTDGEWFGLGPAYACEV